MTIYIKHAGNSKPLEVDFTGTTFGELKAAAPQVNWENTNVIIHSTRTQLINDSSLIPNQDNLILLVVPARNKAGALPYASLKRNDLLSEVRTIISQDPNASSYFGNYPQMKTAAILSLLNGYSSTASTSSADEPLISSIDEFKVLEQKYVQLVNAVSDLNASLGALGNVIFSEQPEESVGGVKLSELDADFSFFEASLRG
jgi:hypothetical protein